jgi:serine/threonine protein kinase
VQRELLAKVLDLPSDASQVDDWMAAAEAVEPSETASEGSDRRMIGDFELCSRLGQGGMGVVYRAVQASLGRQVALKCLMQTGDKAEQRFAREIQALGKVQHPNLIKVFTSGSDGEQFYYAMELVEGANLSNVCDRLQAQVHSASNVNLKTWRSAVSTVSEESHKAEMSVCRATAVAKPGDVTTADVIGQPATTTIDESSAARVDPGSYIRQVVDLVRQAAEATDALHKAGIVHRDIKPGNIMITADGSRAVLMDLGLAQFAEQGSSDKLTTTRQFVGTLRYASTGQVAAIDRLDGRTDVYSLGATLWELLTLRPMFGAGEQMPTPELMKRIQFAEPEKIRKHNSSVSADLESVVLRCLEKNPAERYQTASALAEDLQRWLDNKPVLAQPPTGIYRARKFARRHRKLLAAVALLIVLQAGVAAAIWKMQTPAEVLVDPKVRAKALVRLAASANARDMPADVRFKVEMLKLRDRSDTEGVPLAATGQASSEVLSTFKLSPGEWVAWRVTNTSPKPVDVTMIFVDSQWEMTPIFPAHSALGLNNRLAPNESAMTRAARINATTTGAEHVIVIGAPGVGASVDYRVLAGEHALSVPAPPESRGPDDRMTLGDSALTKLLGDTQTVADERGLDVDEQREYAVHLVTWTVDASSANAQVP